MADSSDYDFLIRLAERLTGQERRIMDLVAKGLTRAQIAEEMAMSERSVVYTVAQVVRLLDAGNAISCAALLTRLGVIDPIDD